MSLSSENRVTRRNEVRRLTREAIRISAVARAFGVDRKRIEEMLVDDSLTTLAVADLVILCRLTGDLALVDAVLAEFGQARKAICERPPTEEGVNGSVGDVMVGAGKLAQDTRGALSDGRIDRLERIALQDDCDRIEEEVRQARAVIAAYEGRQVRA
jgi:hypothetical protein